MYYHFIYALSYIYCSVIAVWKAVRDLIPPKNYYYDLFLSPHFLYSFSPLPFPLTPVSTLLPFTLPPSFLTLSSLLSPSSFSPFYVHLSLTQVNTRERWYNIRVEVLWYNVQSVEDEGRGKGQATPFLSFLFSLLLFITSPPSLPPSIPLSLQLSPNVTVKLLYALSDSKRISARFSLIICSSNSFSRFFVLISLLSSHLVRFSLHSNRHLHVFYISTALWGRKLCKDVIVGSKGREGWSARTLTRGGKGIRGG